MIFTRHLLAVLALLGFAFQSGCATQRAVESAIAAANVAMINPYADLPGPNSSGADQSAKVSEAIQKMDAIIEQYPDQKVLVSQLRFRQAMLLTVNKKDALAKQRWALINRGDLKTERDKAFYDASESLVWAYKTLPEEVRLPASEAQPYVEIIDKAAAGVRTPDVKIYLHSVRALIQFKVASSMAKRSQAGAATKLLADSLKIYVDAFLPKGKDWVEAGGAVDGQSDMAVGEFRHRIWLREMIRNYRKEAEDKKYDPQPQWKPEWVGTVNLN